MKDSQISTQQDLFNLIDQFKLALDCPRLFVANYFEKLKSEIDISSVKILAKEGCDASLINTARRIQIKRLEELESECEKLKLDSKLISQLNETLSQIDTDLTKKDEIYSHFIVLKKHLFSNRTILFSNKLRFKDENDLDHGVLLVLNEYLDEEYLHHWLNNRSKEKILTNDMVKLFHIINTVSLTKDYLVEMNTNDYIKLDKIEFFFKEIVQIDSNAFSGFDQLKILELNRNPVREIKSNAFSNLSRLDELMFEQIHNSLLSTLENETFNGLSNLKVLSINGLNTRGQAYPFQMNKNAFESLKSLEYLRLSYVSIRQSNLEPLHCLTTLKELYLSGNLLSKLDPFTFVNLINLELLYLNFNSIDSLDFVFKSKLSKLKELVLDSNRIEELVIRDEFVLENLTEISLASNLIAKIEDGYFKRMPNLSKLVLFDNAILSIRTNTFSGLANLISLELGQNFIDEIESDAFDSLVELEELDIYLNETNKNKRNRLFQNLTKLKNE